MDALLQFNDLPVLQGYGTVSRDEMTRIAHDRYETFDAQRRISEAAAADAEDLRQIEELAQQLKQKPGGERAE